jgi:hypothetical protein
MAKELVLAVIFLADKRTGREERGGVQNKVKGDSASIEKFKAC